MQKIVNIIAIASGVVSLTVVGSGIYLYTQKDAIIESVTEKALGSIGGGALSGLAGGAGGLPGLPEKTAPEASVPDFAPTGPSQPF
tara:strand:- start:1481 stop:1738 length:258 start_codon:yes stop_codon:yes gene_type:complete